MTLEQILNRLWDEYSLSNPSAGRIHDLFVSEGEEVVNDHVAFRTIDHPGVNIDVLSSQFIGHGYVPAGEYVFSDKHLFARHFELPGDDKAPRIFISQLLTLEVSPYIKNLFSVLMERVPKSLLQSDELIFAGSIFEPLSYEIYNRLLAESEYAAWFYVFGFRANHFTVSINSLKKFDDIIKVNNLLKEKGFLLNSSGGEIKGTREELLQQSSTMADHVKVKFDEGEFDIPSCYYEFAHRFNGPDGRLFSGFIAKSADRIFESTNYYKKKS